MSIEQPISSSRSRARRAMAQTEFLTYGPVHLDVVDRDRSLTWWRDLVGLKLLDEGDESVELGVEGKPLVVLREGATGPSADE